MDYAEEDVPQTIPADLPMEERLELFEKMKRRYNQQVQEIDQAIAENNERIRQLDAKIGATSALGGAGLPVAPQTGTGAANTQMTGQESQTLVAERDRLTAANDQMSQRKEQLKLDLQTKGRVAGIPAGYLRF
jgi:DNA repair ATPase RecN